MESQQSIDSSHSSNASTRREGEPEPKRVRRNGIASSCEPCRKSKLACNHELPCSRCTKGRKDCYYHPNPMSRSNGPTDTPTLPAAATPPVPPVKESFNASTPDAKEAVSRIQSSQKVCHLHVSTSLTTRFTRVYPLRPLDNCHPPSNLLWSSFSCR